MNINETIAEYFERREAEGATMYALCGGRRSGKTFFACQFLLGECSVGAVVNVASMTKEQGRLGAYADCKTIIANNYPDWFDILKSPRQIESRFDYDGNKGVMFFNSYADSETAKGIACDWLFVNEANNFSKQQFVDLMANVRKGVILDYNPNVKFWVDDYFKDDGDICHTTWKDNQANLTKPQLEYFAKLKELGDRPDANPIDKRNYLVYYEGKYAEISGKIFHSANMQRIAELPQDLKHFMVFCDPSALRGADWFPLVLSAYSESLGGVVVVDVDSTNQGTRELQARKILEWCKRYDDVSVYVETNGIIGAEFYDYCSTSGLPVQVWYSRGNKFDRITALFEDITTRMWFADTPTMDGFLLQCYDFEQRCEHDDNIDAIASTAMLHKLFV